MGPMIFWCHNLGGGGHRFFYWGPPRFSFNCRWAPKKKRAPLFFFCHSFSEFLWKIIVILKKYHFFWSYFFCPTWKFLKCLVLLEQIFKNLVIHDIVILFLWSYSESWSWLLNISRWSPGETKTSEFSEKTGPDRYLLKISLNVTILSTF